MVPITVLAEEITNFHSKNEWINKASSRLAGFSMSEKIICVDQNNCVCTIGLDFRIAEEHILYPVTAFRLIRTSEYCKI